MSGLYSSQSLATNLRESTDLLKIRKAMITGGAGFVGSNYAKHLLDMDAEVVVFDNFARGKGCENNLQWLRSHPKSRRLKLVKGEVGSIKSLEEASKDCDLILHAAAQVSVPESVSKPRLDFDSNALGTFNVLEVTRKLETTPVLIYTSSNKVYGIPDAALREGELGYEFEDLSKGVDESFALKGEEPYGTSKASGDLYLYAYSEQYGVKTVSFRCSCMYGPRQWGKEEQGWVAWFCIAAVLGRPLNIFGNGKQVRDLLYIDDVINGFDSATSNISKVSGKAFNLGGGRQNAVSLLETIAHLEKLTGRKLRLTFKDWRPGDNKCYYTDYSKAKRMLEWEPRVPWKEGIERTLKWVQSNLPQISSVFA